MTLHEQPTVRRTLIAHWAFQILFAGLLLWAIDRFMAPFDGWVIATGFAGFVAFLLSLPMGGVVYLGGVVAGILLAMAGSRMVFRGPVEDETALKRGMWMSFWVLLGIGVLIILFWKIRLERSLACPLFFYCTILLLAHEISRRRVSDCNRTQEDRPGKLPGTLPANSPDNMD